MMLVHFKKDMVTANCVVIALTWIIFLKISCGFCALETKNVTSPIHNDILNDSDKFPDSHKQIISPDQRKKVIIKRALPQRYRNAYYNKRNRPNRVKYHPAEYTEYDYDYLTTEKLRNRRRNHRRPIGFDYDDNYDDYDYEQRPHKWNPQKRRNRNKNRMRDNDFNNYSSENLNDNVEHVTMIVKPRQQQQTMMPTTTTEPTTTPSATNITNGTTQGTPTTNSSTTFTGYGYGPPSSNDNVSITYGPPSVPKPIYGIPGSAPGVPISSWSSIHHNLPGYHHQSAYGYVHNSHQPSSNPYKHPIYNHHTASSGDQANYAVPHSFYEISDNYGSYSRTNPYHYSQHDTSDVARENDVYPIISRLVSNDY
ncbi:uncharacterized protein LOC143197419 [Rhynchophorus ferrugineus]|uniref:uncharacterized protein LOC143197419 n=1 Tax=Rhynchophorus ferrugineus TaxID=354439 RepID=UPI003FCD070A